MAAAGNVIHIERVRCLDCSTSYSKPAGGGTGAREPGLPALRLPRLDRDDGAYGTCSARPLRRGSAPELERPTALTPPK